MTKIDDSVKKKVPELRFKGFTDDWKQCKFSNLAEVRRGLTYKPSDVQQYGIRVLRSSNIAEDTFLIKSDDVFVNKEAVKIDKVKNGDILITAANGSNRLVGKHALIEGIENDTVHGGFMLVARAEKPEFVNAIMSSSWYSKFINIFVSGGNGAIGNLSKSDLENQKVYVPSEIEQQKIGSFFKQLDDTIALHQRKLDLLKEQKKGFLQKMFPKNGAKVPELRFAGFADDWEERKLGDISYKVKEKNKTGEFTETLTNSAEYGIINQRDFFNKDISNAKNLTGYYVVKNDDFVYNPRISNFAPVGPIKRNRLGRTGVMSPLYYVFRTHDIDKNYLEKYFDTVYWHRFMKLNGDSGVRADRFAIKESVFVEMPIPYPTIEEQEKIGSFFKQLDDTIALHQRKLDLLKEQKKGFLQKMFPKNGAKVPELRFAGFADDWEERKLGDISYKVKEKNKTGEFTETLTNSAEYGIINQRDFFNKDISNAKNLTGYYVVKNDDFVYNPRISNFAPVGPIKRNRLGRTGVMSPLYYVFRTHDIDKNYLEKYFDTVYWHRFMKLNGDSGVRADRFAIKESVFVEMPIPYPTIEEQEKIGSFFKQLDDTIALHQRKLDLLKEQKKGFLQKMFV